MTTGAAESGSEGRIVLDGELSIYTAAETFAQLREEIAGMAVCDLDLSGVSEMDSAGLQLLLWLSQTCEAQGTPFRVSAHSDAVAEVVRLLQLTQRLGIASDPAAEESSS